jgi:hypothetical protein
MHHIKLTGVRSHRSPIGGVALDTIVGTKVKRAVDIMAGESLDHLHGHYGEGEDEEVHGRVDCSVWYDV